MGSVYQTGHLAPLLLISAKLEADTWEVLFLFHLFHRSTAVVVCFFLCLLHFIELPGIGPSFAIASRGAMWKMPSESSFPMFEFFDPDVSGTDFGDHFFHIHDWEQVDLNNSFFEDPEHDSSSTFAASLKSAQPYHRTRLTLGRQRIHGGVTNNRVDGLKVTAGLGSWFSAIAFGGLPSPMNKNKSTSGDLIYGARIATHPMSIYEIGLSYHKLMDDTENVGENAGADFTLKLGSRLTINGLSNYNIEGRGWREHSYSAVLNVNRFQIKPSYRYFQLDDHFDKHSAESHLFGFVKKKEEVANIAGADILWRGLGPLQMGVRGRQFDYEVSDERAFYYAGLLNLKTELGSRIDMEFGRMEGETPENKYSLFRCSLYWKEPLRLKNSFLNADILYIDYDESIYNRDDALHASLNGGLIFPRQNFEIKLSGIYSRDPYFNDDLGALVSFVLRY